MSRASLSFCPDQTIALHAGEYLSEEEVLKREEAAAAEKHKSHCYVFDLSEPPVEVRD